MAALEDIRLAGGHLQWCSAAVPVTLADEWFSRLRKEISWNEETLLMYGRKVTVPRLIAWHGDPTAGYQYSGVVHEPEPWIPCLMDIRHWLREFCGYEFNSVLANLYRRGTDAMGWHADNEPELGDQPAIASVSLGATRRMRFRSNRTTVSPDSSSNAKSFHLDLTHGSLLLMVGETQQHWQHMISRTRRPVGERINLTFRSIVQPRLAVAGDSEGLSCT